MQDPQTGRACGFDWRRRGSLILAKEALKARMEKANEAVRGKHVHTVPTGGKACGYGPQRKTAKRRDRSFHE